MDRISIIIPVYNVEQFLCKCIDSIIHQEYSDYEIILINDGSTDQSGVICDKYAAADNRIQVIHVKNGGPSRARNIGINNASGDWLLFVDSDDWIEDNMFHFLLGSTLANIDIVMYGYYLVMDDAKKTILPQYEGLIKIDDIMYIRKLYHQMWNYIVRRDVIVNNNIYFSEDVKYAEDTEFMVKCVVNSKQICCINKPLYYHRQQSASLTAFVSLRNNMDHITIGKRIIDSNSEQLIKTYTAATLIIRYICCMTMNHEKSIFMMPFIIWNQLSEIRTSLYKHKLFLDRTTLLKIQYPVLYYFYLKFKRNVI